MTQEQKRIKLAEAGGWTNIREQDYDHGYSGDDVRQYWMGTPPDDLPTQLPDYFNDLNAVHELEKVLTEDQYDDYRQHLGKAVGYLWRGIFSATAAQRAEALGKTLNLW